MHCLSTRAYSARFLVARQYVAHVDLHRHLRCAYPAYIRGRGFVSSTDCSRDSPDASQATERLRQGSTVWQVLTTGAPESRRTGVQDGALQRLRRSAFDSQEMVLPRGFPDTVAPGYAGYTGWLATGLFAHSFMVMVSTNALLSGFFAEMSAASWLMKDLVPPLMAGTLASRIRTLEANPKKWLAAAVFLNSGLGVTEFLIPHLMPMSMWMPLAICTNTGKMTGYLIIGASRAVLQKTLATGDNLGEVTAKLGTLGMLMHCFGAATALTLIQFLGFWGQLGAISTGAVVGFYAPVRASRCVIMSQLSPISLRKLARRWASARSDLNGAVAGTVAFEDGGRADQWTCPSPAELHEELAARWSVAYSFTSRVRAWRELISPADATVVHVSGAGGVSIGVSLHVAPALSSPDDVAALVDWRTKLSAAGIAVPTAWALGATGKGQLMLLYSQEATNKDVIEGFAVAWLAANAAADQLCDDQTAAAMAGLAEVSASWLPAWRREAAGLHAAMETAGWRCLGGCIDDITRRVEWVPSHKA